jgi:hypothetical protein
MGVACIKCDRIFTSHVYLTRHINRKIPCDRKLECGRCGKEFTQLSNFNSHINRKNPCAIKEKVIVNKCLELELAKEITKQKDKAVELAKEITKQKDKEFKQEQEKTKQAKLNKGKTVINNNTIQNIFGDQHTHIHNIDEIQLVKPPSIWYAEQLIKTNNTLETLKCLIKYQFNNDEYPKNKCLKNHDGEIYSKMNNKAVLFNKYKYSLIETIQNCCKYIDYDYGSLSEEEIYAAGLSQRSDYIQKNEIDTLKKVDKFVGNIRNNKLLENAVKLVSM